MTLCVGSHTKKLGKGPKTLLDRFAYQTWYLQTPQSPGLLIKYIVSVLVLSCMKPRHLGCRKCSN